MNSDTPGSAVRAGGNPVLRILTAFPIACFACALATDLAYAQTADMMWADFSAWLLAAGIFMANRRAPEQRPGWPLVIGSLLVLILAFFDNLVHSRDAWTSVVPWGLALSAATVIVMLITAWLGSGRVSRRGVGVQYSGAHQ